MAAVSPMLRQVKKVVHFPTETVYKQRGKDLSKKHKFNIKTRDAKISILTMERGVAISHNGIHAQTYQLAMFRVCDIGMVDYRCTKCFECTRSAVDFG